MPPEDIISAIDASPLNRGLDGATWLSSPENIAFEIGDNISLFEGCGDGVFEVHFLFVSRGRNAVIAARESFRRMFKDHGAETLFGLIPDFNRAAKLMTRWAGAKSAGKRMTSEGMCELFVISKYMWSDKWAF